MKNIILCGFMGCGKSTVGRKLSRRANMEFVDMDRYIENKAGMTVKEIFAKYGEQKFRDMEREACKELAERDNLVIAAGGGTLTFPENVETLRRTGRIVLIDVKYEILCERLKHDKNRPLLQVENRNEKIRTLLDERMPLYSRAASVVVNGNFGSVDVAANILAILH